MNSLQRKLTLIITLTSFLALLVAGLFFVGFDYIKFKETQVNELKVLSEVIGSNSSAAIDFNDPDTGNEILSMLRAVPQVEQAALFTADGRLFARYSRDGVPTDQEIHKQQESGHEFDGQFLSYQADVKNGDRNIGYIHLYADLATEKERWNRYLLILIAMGFAALFVAIIVGYKLQNVITKPVTNLSEVATKVTNEKDYSIRVKEQGVDELRNLTIAFNDMLERIEERSSERDAAEEKLKDHRDHLEELVNERTEALQNSNKELEAFSYSVSHDLRAPLRSIHGFCQLLVEDYADSLDETGLDYLRRTQKSSLKMTELIESLLQLAKISRTDFKPRDYDLSFLAEEAITKLQEQNKDRFVEIHIIPNIHSECDDNLLSIAFDNLIGNAWKYTRDVEHPVIEFGVTSTSKNNNTYFVKDNGVGFDMTHADTIFMAFKRLHSDEEFPGTGVGLATVSRIIERHGGEIWVESEEAVGTTFYFTLNPGNARVVMQDNVYNITN